MNAMRTPTIGSWYTNEDGLSLRVIGMGTHGVVVELPDGSAELVDRKTWKALDMEAGPDNQHNLLHLHKG